jgi:hypothetical protein
MSYVVCSNSTFDNENLQGISSANSFQNHFKSPLIIEPNSEVGVESVKINRQDKFDIVESDEFFVYFGEELSSTTPSGSVTTNGVKIDIPVGSYDTKAFARALTDAINKAPLNPAIYEKCSVSVKSDGTSNLFAGFKFSWDLRTSTDDSDISASFTESQFVDGNNTTSQENASLIANGSTVRQFEYDEGSSTINCCRTRATNVDYNDANESYFNTDCAVRVQTKPLSNGSGIFTVDLTANSASNSWLVGLSRPTTHWYNAGYPRYITSTAENSGHKQQRFLNPMPFCDYWVEFSNGCATTGGVDKLKVKHWGKNTDPRQWTIQEIEYWGNASSPFNASSQIDTEKMNASGLRYLHFTLVGNELKIYIGDTSDLTKGNQYYLVDSAKTLGTTDSTYNFPPLGNSEEFLCPVIAMTSATQKIIIDKYDVFDDIKLFSFPTTSSFRRSNNFMPKLDNGLVAGSDWWSQAEVSQRGQKEIRFNELRPSTLWYGNDNALANYRYKNLNGSNAINYNVVMVVNKEDFIEDFNQFKQALYVIPINENQANMGRILGFQTFPTIPQSLYGSPTSSSSSVEFESFNSGEFAVSSCFVRLNDLTISSFNGAKNSKSQILYHIPRFTNDGKQYGELYFTAPEKTYIKLNNTDKIMLNNIKIDIVDRNERVVGDLSGSTIVALHFRQSK